MTQMTPELRAELEAWARKRQEKQRSAQPDQALRDHVTRGQQDTGKGDTPQVVQVRIVGAPRAYGYVWNGAEPLELRDWVMLPGNAVSPEGCKGRVEGFGRDGYDGPLKEVVSRIERPDPWIARMDAVKNSAEARRIFMAAKRAELDPQALQKLERVGRETLAKLPSIDGNVSNALGHNGGAQR